MISRILRTMKRVVGLKGSQKISVTHIGAYTLLDFGSTDSRYVLKLDEAEQMVGALNKIVREIKNKYKLGHGENT